MATKKAKRVQKKVARKKVVKKAPVRVENIDIVKYFKTGVRDHLDDWAYVEDNVIYCITNYPKDGDSIPAGIKVDGYVIINGDDVKDNVGDFGDVVDKLQDYDEKEITTSFKCLENAGVNLQKIKVLETVKDLEATCDVGQKGFKDFESTVPQGATYKEYPATDGYGDPIEEDETKIVSKRYHRAGCMLIREGKFSYICSMDEDSYFVTKLPKHSKTISDAYKSLKPKKVQAWEKKTGKRAIRQGEWFFIPTEIEKLKGMRRKGLPLWEKGGNKHMADSYVVQDDINYVKDGVHHIDHESTHLGDVIHEAIMNTQLGSWSEQGVD